MTQELIAFGIVGLVFAGVAFRIFKSWFAPPLSEWLLKQGRIKAAMKVRKFSKGGCFQC